MDEVDEEANRPPSPFARVKEPGVAQSGVASEVAIPVRRPASGKGTVLEALIAELLGDIGDVHHGVQGLKDALPGIEAAIRAAGDSAGGAFRESVTAAISELAEATRAERAAAAAAGEETSLAIKSISAVTTQMTINHKGTLDAHLAGLVEAAAADIGRRAGDVLADLKVEAGEVGKSIKRLSKDARAAGAVMPRFRLVGILVGAAMIGAAAGAGLAWTFRARPSSDQTVAIQAGLDVERAFAVLDPPTREKVIEAIKRTSPKVDR